MRLSIIIIEFHGMEDVKACTSNIAEQLSNIDYECVIVSNSNYDESELQRAQKEIVQATILSSGGNLGYAGGVNKGLQHTSGEYIYVLNPDCLLLDSGVVEIMEAMDRDKKWAFSGPKVLDEQGMVQPSCRRFPRPWTFLLVRSKLSQLPFAQAEQIRYLMKDFNHEVEKVVDWLSGGALIVKREALKAIGSMDERYFLYMEDVDWCRAGNSKQYIAKYVPSSVVRHSGQHASISGNLLTRLQSPHLRYHLVSMLKYFLKWFARA